MIETAQLYAVDDNAVHNKFDYFKYYKSFVRYDNDVFPIYLNVGRAKNDKTFHFYDITNKIRETARRINGVERVDYDLRSENSFSFDDSLTQNEPTVNTQYMQNGENDAKNSTMRGKGAVHGEDVEGDFDYGYNEEEAERFNNFIDEQDESLKNSYKAKKTAEREKILDAQANDYNENIDELDESFKEYYKNRKKLESIEANATDEVNIDETGKKSVTKTQLKNLSLAINCRLEKPCCLKKM